MDLYIKCGRETGSVGDCPFAHFVRMVLEVKGLTVKIHPCRQEDKPEWLKEEFGGKMPCLVNHGEKKVESSVIAEYLDEKYPDPPLRQGFEEKRSADAQTASAKFFPTLAKLLKSPEFDFSAEKAFLTTVRDLDNFLSENKFISGQFLLGPKISLLDCEMAPKLYVMNVALKHFYPDSWDKLAEFKFVRSYCQTVFETDAFTKTKCPEETVIWGWESARDSSKN